MQQNPKSRPLEISSFQLETIQTFRPKVAVVLNVTPDHLDRHGTFEAYRDAKLRIFERARAYADAGASGLFVPNRKV